MSRRLKDRQVKIQEKKKGNSFRNFVCDIASRYPLVLYKQKELISLYDDNERSCPVVSHSEFEKNIESLLECGLTYNAEECFFEQFQRLLKQTPFSSLYNYSGAENSSFAFAVLNSKNCYLSFTVITNCENVVYSFAVKEGCKNVFSSAQVSDHSENIFHSSCVLRSYAIFYSRFIENSSNLWWCTNMVGCCECILCDGLENSSYCVENVQYEKNEYLTKKESLLSDKEDNIKKYQLLSCKGANRGSSEVIESNFVVNSSQVSYGMYSFNLVEAKNTLVVGSPNLNSHIYDAFEAGSLGNSHFYGVLNTGVNSEHIYNSEGIVTCFSVYYSRFLENCSYCLGCIGLRNKKYCILNKQYSKDKRFEMVDKIFERMEKDVVLGDYFPGWINPFYFNDTIASLVIDFTKEEVEAKGYLWREEEIAVDIPEWMEVVEVGDLGAYEGWNVGTQNIASVPGMKIPDEAVRHIDPSILKKVIRDEEGNVYRVIKMEYDFLMKHRLPLPREHWLKRLKGHFSVTTY